MNWIADLSDEERFDPEYEDEVIAELMARRVDQQLHTQASCRVVRARPTQNPSVAVVEVRGRSSMDAVTEELRAVLVKFASEKSLQGRWGTSQPPKGSVIRWVKTFEQNAGRLTLSRSPLDDDDEVSFDVQAPTVYVYVAIRANDGRWYVTGNRGRGRYDWESLIKEIGDTPCQVVSEWTEVPVPEKPSEESLDPEAWARMMFGSKPVEQTD
jgi:hypothetical protein